MQMKTKFALSITGLLAILALVVGTYAYYNAHPEKVGTDRFDHFRPNGKFVPHRHE